MLLAILIVANIPVYLFLAWLVFDTKANAEVTLAETLFALLKRIAIPRVVRFLLDDNEEFDGAGCLATGFYLAACISVVWLEYYLLTR